VISEVLGDDIRYRSFEDRPLGAVCLSTPPSREAREEDGFCCRSTVSLEHVPEMVKNDSEIDGQMVLL